MTSDDLQTAMRTDLVDLCAYADAMRTTIARFHEATGWIRVGYTLVSRRAGRPLTVGWEYRN